VTFEQIEDAVMARIKTEMPYVKTVETYAGQLEGEIEKLAIPFPAVFVVYGGSDYQWVDGKSFNDAPGLSVIIAAKDLRGSEDLRKGQYGCYRMIRDVLKTVASQTFGFDIWPMKPVKVSLILISRIMAAYGIDFQTGFDTEFD